MLKTRHALLLICALITTPAIAKPITACEGNERNLKTYLTIHEVLFMKRDTTRVAEFYAPSVISHNTDSGGDGARNVNTAQLTAMWDASRRNHPDRTLTDELILCAGDFVVVRTRIRNRDTVGVAGLPATNRDYNITGIDIYRFENGKVVERWGNSDLASMYKQLGHLVVPGPAK